MSNAAPTTAQINKVQFRRVTIIRPQSEIAKRAFNSLMAKDDSWAEYLRQAEYSTAIEVAEEIKGSIPAEDWVVETWQEIAETARNYFAHLKTVTNEDDLNRGLRMMRAWKWLLGHYDADTFESVANTEGQTAIVYLDAQFTSGEFDLMSKYHYEKRGYYVVEHNGEHVIERVNQSTSGRPDDFDDGNDVVVSLAAIRKLERMVEPFNFAGGAL